MNTYIVHNSWNGTVKDGAKLSLINGVVIISRPETMYCVAENKLPGVYVAPRFLG